MALQLDLVWGTARLRQEILHDSSFHPVLPHWGTLAMSVATPVALMFAALICIDVKGLPLFWLILSARIDNFDHLTNLVVSGNHPKWCFFPLNLVKLKVGCRWCMKSTEVCIVVFVIVLVALVGLQPETWLFSCPWLRPLISIGCLKSWLKAPKLS